MLHQGFAGGAVPGDDVDDTSGQSRFLAEFGENERCERSKFGGLQNHRVSCRQRGRDFPRQHEKRKIPGNNLADDAAGFVAGELLLEQLRPTSVVVEMPRHQRNVDVAALANGLTVVHGLEDRKKPGMFLYEPRECIEIARTGMRSQGAPWRRGSTRGANGRVHVGSTALRDFSQPLAIRRIEGVEVSTGRGRLPGPADEKSKAASVTLQPRFRFFGIFRGRSVLHADKVLCDAHSVQLA